jgi:hypothetical protein
MSSYVVRVVTREERLAKSNAILIRLDLALERWRDVASELNVSEAERRVFSARRETVVALLKNDQFAEFNQSARVEIDFLARETKRRQEEADARRVAAWAERMQARQNAKMLRAALTEKGVVLEAELLEKLESVARGRADDDLAERVLAEGFRRLAPQNGEEDWRQDWQLTEEQKALARRLSETGEEPRLEAWKGAGTHPVDPQGVRLEAITRQLERLRQTPNQADAILDFEQRLERAQEEPETARQGMMLDALQIELAAALRLADAYVDLCAEATALDAELAALASPEAHAMRASLAACVKSGDAERLSAQMDACRALLHAATQAKAARIRRDALLQSFAALGYVVREGMETLWGEQGRVLLQKPGLAGYGVELSGAPTAERLQLRTVALDHPARDAAHDIDVEQMGCDDFSRLQAELAEKGLQMFVDKTLAAGANPLKVVEGAENAENTETARAHARRAASLLRTKPGG